MSKSLRQLFGAPPPTTYEILEKNLKPENYVEMKREPSSNSNLDQCNGTANAIDHTSNTTFATDLNENASADKRKERSDNDSTFASIIEIKRQPWSNSNIDQCNDTAIAVDHASNTTFTTDLKENASADKRKERPDNDNSFPSEQIPKKKKKVNKRQRMKQNKAKRTQAASLNHFDRPYHKEDKKELDLDDLFSGYEELKAKKEKFQEQKPLPYHNANQSKPQPSSNLQSINFNRQRGQEKISNHVNTMPDFHLPTGKDNIQKQVQQKKPFVPRKLCNYYLKGLCKAGDNCTFKHEGPQESRPPATSKVVCQFFKTGSCTQFDGCYFSHDLKLEPCRFFHMSGSCEHGDTCPYSHEPLNEDRLKRLRLLTGPCRFYHFKGYCNNPDTCLFSHDAAPEDKLKEVESAIKPCRFYHIFKSCAKGDDCFYAHDEATPAQIQELINEENKKKSN